ncbi:MAG TPA: sigma-70 family RNA polymerase sigma factor [Bacteroidales bacterium]|nr:sigma-70 family RNA polymerase sigma factor [Bacteroidales bacterium]
MGNYSNEEIVKGFRERRAEILSHIYRQVFPLVKYYVKTNNGNEEDAKDVFQESLVIAYRNLNKPGFTITENFEGYIYSTSRLLWLKTLEKRRVAHTNAPEIVKESANQEKIDEETESIKYGLYQKHFKKLDKVCRKLLSLFLKNTSYETIAEELGFSSAEYAKRRKYLCQKTLIDRIKKDSDFDALR